MQTEAQIAALLAEMTLGEKLGQLQQCHGGSEAYWPLLRQGRIGSILNLVDARRADGARVANQFQRIAVEESRLGIPLIFGRDVIHGFRTMLPIPLGQAASFDPALAEAGARMAASEATACGYNWTFAPMVDVARDARWGRIAESAGEDPLLNARMGAAMVRGFQGDDLRDPTSMAACAKHFVGYGAAESGRDYNSTWIPLPLLHDVNFPPFHACVAAGVATLMSAFSDLNGVPASGNSYTLRAMLKQAWGFDGFVVSDWTSVQEMIAHGYCADERDAALKGLRGGVDMEMVSTCYADHVQALLDDGLLEMAQLDDAVLRILRVKARLGLFDAPYCAEDRVSVLCSARHRAMAQRLATESCVLLKNDGLLPLSPALPRVAVIGPLADNARAQMGCWTVDGFSEDVITLLPALRAALAGTVAYAPGVSSPRDTETTGIAAAAELAAGCDVAILALGEDELLSGEAHSRAFLTLPGAQQALLDAVAATGTPVVVVLLAGRPLELGPVLDRANALLYAWHPGTMGGPAVAELLTGMAVPSGKLPVSMPRAVGQMPLYYAHHNTGRPAPEGARVLPTGTPLDPEGFTSTYLDVDHRPLFPFGFGLSYTTFAYRDLRLSARTIGLPDTLTVSVTVANTGAREGDEVVQFYVRDLVGSLARPVKELKDFQRIRLAPGEARELTFTLHPDQLAFHDTTGTRLIEPGGFQVLVGGSSAEVLTMEFTLEA